MPPVERFEYYEYITPDGQSYSFEVGPLSPYRLGISRSVLQVSGEGMPDIDTLTEQGPLQHGETLVDYRLKPRILQLTYREQACSRADIWDRRGGRTMTAPGGARLAVAGLLDLLRPNRQTVAGLTSPGILRKHLPGSVLRDLQVYLIEGLSLDSPDPDSWDAWAATGVLRFLAPDPVWTEPTAKVATLTALGANPQLVFPITFPITWGASSYTGTTTATTLGTWPVFPIITLNGPLDNPVIANLTTNEYLRLAITIALGQTVTINLAYGVKSILLGTANLVGFLSSDSDLATWHLAPHPEAAGGVNSIQLSGVNAGIPTALQVNWLDRYIGI